MVSQNLLALFKAPRFSKKGFVASKLIHSEETIAAVILYALVILTDIHLYIQTEKTAK